jgi:hypothetical protein
VSERSGAEKSSLAVRPTIVPTTRVFVGDDEPLPHTGEWLLYGTLIATGARQDGNGLTVPIMPPSGEWLLLTPPLGHTMVQRQPGETGSPNQDRVAQLNLL